eukprot:858769_1
MSSLYRLFIWIHTIQCMAASYWLDIATLPTSDALMAVGSYAGSKHISHRYVTPMHTFHTPTFTITIHIMHKRRICRNAHAIQQVFNRFQYIDHVNSIEPVLDTTRRYCIYDKESQHLLTHLI